MRRILGTSALLSLFTPGPIALPAAAPALRARPHAVAATVRTLAVHGALRRGTARFDTVGASWDRGATGAVEVRTRAHSRWSRWQPLEADDFGADDGSSDAAHAARGVVSAPLFAGASDGVQVRSVGGAVPGLKVALVDGGTSAADADPAGTGGGAGTASAAAAQPAVFTRAQWGADERLRSFQGSDCTIPDYSDTIKVAFVHHTDTANGYSAAQVPAILRGIYAFHVQSRGWCDIGYNFLVDRFGRVWEGRYGGITRAVVGAHTGGFNANSFAASMIGSYGGVAPPPVAMSALQRLLTWKLSLFHADPTGLATLTSAGGSTSRYAAGVTHTFRVVSGHRDAGFTDCPGDALYARLPGLRTAVRGATGAGLVLPVLSARTRPYGGVPVVVTAGVLRTQTWRLDVRRASDDVVVRTFTGSSTRSLSVSFNLKDRAGAPLPPSGYRMQLSSTDGVHSAVPWSTPFDVLATASSPPPPGAPLVPDAAWLTPLRPTRVLDSRTGLGLAAPQELAPKGGRVEVRVLGRGGVPATGVAAVAVNLTVRAHDGPSAVMAYSAANPWPTTAAVNAPEGQQRTGLVMSRLGADGRLSLYNVVSASDVMLDVVGYFPTTGGSTYTPLVPKRVLDTRTANQPLPDQQVRTVDLQVPADATGVVANVTVVAPASAGTFTAYAPGTLRPGFTTLSFARGEPAENRVLIGARSLALYARGTRTDVVVDIVGFFSKGRGQVFSPLALPARLVDTRYANGVSTRTALPAGSTTVVPVAGGGGIPADAQGIVMILTTPDAKAVANIQVWSGMGSRPSTHDLTAVRGRSTADLVVVPLSPRGSLSVAVSTGPTQLIGDVLGYLR